MMKAVRLLSGVAVAWMLAGCHLAVPQPEDVGTARRFTQVSLFSMLLCGRYGGVVDLGWVKDRLDGEVMMVDGVVYQVKSDGTVRCPSAFSGLDLSRDRSDELKRAEAER